MRIFFVQYRADAYTEMNSKLGYKRNWRNYNKELVQRGSLTFLIDPKILPTLKSKRLQNRRGQPKIFSDRLIEPLLVMENSFLFGL